MHRRAFLQSMTLLPALLAGVPAAAREVDEDALKAAYLLNFTRLIEWPAAPRRISLCVIEAGEMARYRGAVEDGDVPTDLTLLSVNDPVPANCNIQFVRRAAQSYWPDIRSKVAGRALLTVGEGEGFIAQGGILRFYLDGGHVRFAINPDRARAAGLRVSSKLLSLARIEN